MDDKLLAEMIFEEEQKLGRQLTEKEFNAFMEEAELIQPPAYYLTKAKKEETNPERITYIRS